MRRSLGLRVLAPLVVLIACSKGSQPAELDPDLVAAGAELYQKNCASCHRADLSGDPNWKTPNEDGSYPPPPHDSSGHTLHHPVRVFIDIIRNGGSTPESRMPPSATGSATTTSEPSSSSSRTTGDLKNAPTKQQATEQDQTSS